MLRVGLTGGIGSGKSTIAKIFNTLGIPVFYADLEIKILMNSSEELIDSIKNNFGEQAYSEGKLNRNYISELVFNDPAKLRKLNQITHPAVHRYFEDWVTGKTGNPYIVEEAALLCETGAWKNFDYLVLVIAPLSKKIERVMSRDDVAEIDVRKRMLSQMQDEEKIPLAHFLIFNDDENMVLNQVLALHKKMIYLNNK